MGLFNTGAGGKGANGPVENRGRGSEYWDPTTGDYVQGAVDPVTGQREDADTQLQNDYLYGGAPGGAAAFNQQTAGVAGRYGSALSNAGQQYADAAQTRGSGYGAELAGYGQNTYGQGQGLLASGQNAINGVNPDAYVDAGSLNQSQLDAASMTGAAAGQEGAAAKLMNMNFGGPSAAEAQLNAGAQQTAAQNLALAQSGRGMGGSAAARRAAMAQNAQVMGQMNGQLGALRAQETATQQQEALQATQAAAGAYGGAGNTYGGAAGVNSQNLGTVANARNAAVGNANQLGLGMTNAGVSALGQGISGINAGASTDIGATTAAGNLALGGYGAGAQTELGGQQVQNSTNVAALQGTMGYEGGMLAQRGQNLGVQTTNEQQQNQNNMALLNAGISAVGSGVGAAAMISDRTAKTDTQKLTPEQISGMFGGGQGGLSNALPGLAAMADRRKAQQAAEGMAAGGGAYDAAGSVKGGAGSDAARFRSSLDAFRRELDGNPYAEDMPDPQAMRAHLLDANPYGPTPAQAQDTIRNAPAYAFRYKDPERHGEGQRVGVMAQDLEKTPAGAAAVMRSPEGTRAISDPELTTINTAALNGQQTQLDDTMARLDEIEKRLKKRDQGFVAPQPVNTDDLDWAYGREASAPR